MVGVGEGSTFIVVGFSRYWLFLFVFPNRKAHMAPAKVNMFSLNL